MSEVVPSPDWDPNVPELHRRIVDTGMFDLIPQAEQFEQDEVVVARHNGNIYHVRELDGVSVRIWYETPDKQADEVVARDSVRPINGYAQIAYGIAEPMVEVTVDRQGRAEIKRPVSERPAPPFPGNN